MQLLHIPSLRYSVPPFKISHTVSTDIIAIILLPRIAERVMEQNGLWYHLWEKKHQPGHAVEQLLLFKKY